jgi:SAM-dependent methyltransferase
MITESPRPFPIMPPLLHDPWLERWLPSIARYAQQGPILELGCGPGDDTATLAAAGHPVIALDRSPAAVAQTRARVPGAEVHQQDVRAPFPVGPGGASVILASLSLHYFAWPETCDLVARIHQTLAPRGLFLCRVNSTADHHFGARGHPEIAQNYYSVNGEPKRFFDRPTLLKLFTPAWTLLSIEEQLTHKYEQPKALWELALEAKA